MKIFLNKLENELDLWQRASADFKIKNNQIIFNINGKPLFKNSKIHFNKSHSYDYICYAFNTVPIGIDTEKIRDFDLKILDYFFDSKEKEYILKADTKKRFFKLWTLKEAIIKMNGLSLKDIKDLNLNIPNLKTIQIESEDYIITIVTKKSQ